MKFKFDSNLDYQNKAVKAVTDLFKGQAAKAYYFPVNGQVSFDYVIYDEDNVQYIKT